MKIRRATGGVRLFAHTADVGIEARGETLSDLFTWAARGLARVAVGPGAGRKRPTLNLPVDLPEAPDLEALLVDWLNHLIYLYETDQIYPVWCDLEVADSDGDVDANGGGRAGGGWTLRGVIHAVPLSTAEPASRTAVKAATYHGLQIVRPDEAAGRGGRGYRARVILDI